MSQRGDTRPVEVRHDLAHVMASAVQRLWPETRVTIGPVTDTGWFYDFDRAEPFTPEDLGTIEAEMRRIIAAREPVRDALGRMSRALVETIAKGETLTEFLLVEAGKLPEKGLAR